MDIRAPRLDLPDTPRTFGFFLNGKSVPAGDREIMERASPGPGTPVTRVARVLTHPRDLAQPLGHRAQGSSQQAR